MLCPTKAFPERNISIEDGKDCCEEKQQPLQTLSFRIQDSRFFICHMHNVVADTLKISQSQKAFLFQGGS